MENISKIKMIVCDLDGTLTDGRKSVNTLGMSRKSYHTRDLHYIEKSAKEGMMFFVVTNSHDRCDGKRFNSFFKRIGKHQKINFGYNGVGLVQTNNDKLTEIHKLIIRHNIKLSEVCFVGDGINDISAFEKVTHRYCPSDADPIIKEMLDPSEHTDNRGGFGAVAEVIGIVDNYNHHHNRFYDTISIV